MDLNKELKADAKILLDFLLEQKKSMYEIDDTAFAISQPAWHSIIYMARKLTEGEPSTYIQVLKERIIELEKQVKNPKTELGAKT